MEIVADLVFFGKFLCPNKTFDLLFLALVYIFEYAFSNYNKPYVIEISNFNPKGQLNSFFWALNMSNIAKKYLFLDFTFSK